MLHTLSPTTPVSANAVDIIVPVFNAIDDLRRCLQSLQQHTPAQARIIIIDDASSDPAVDIYLRELARLGLENWVILRQPSNQGFVRTANLGMTQSRSDVVLLNSDTLVTAGWLDGLQRCLRSDAKIGTATPFSNNAEICSFPNFCQANPVPDDLQQVSQVIGEVASRDYPELPTAVGFCMAISRAAIDAVGLFDTRFGRGYGEENDFCRRLAQQGFRNVLCDDVFVAHVGGRSFAPLGLQPGGENLQLLIERHPDYESLVAAFVAADPIAPIRERICRALARVAVTAGEGL